MRFRSLHARLVAGVMLWTLGLCALAGLVGFVAISFRPEWGLMIHNSMLIVTATMFVVAGVSVIRRGLSPFRTLRDRLADVREGRTGRLEGEYPTELQPLVADLNALLDERERRVARAVAKAGDLAHGLKTPLAIVAQDIERADAVGQHELADSIRGQVERMRRQIDSHLAQTRVTAAGVTRGVRTNIAQSALGLVRTMERLYADRALVIAFDAPGDFVVAVPVEDFEEMLGNLLDNACKWAKSHVTASARLAGAHVVIAVDDDGAGLSSTMREQVLQRGVRADETAPGSGLGLAIVRDLAEAYGGSIVLKRAPEGGVRAQLLLPAQS